ncbi:MAG: plastocyanin/azurin family copper-binding protein [Hymenobacteraceae bacterium]|nr:plastocyanin/azurin family copper-binding protein [Hymenobacteraceae bacterium]MDX5395141.1 plastocyanin/azurin family copper-binding protein [Hymenobacteraceae bacterium]MDX5444332.1 plastocyanin/azurin family copper-binding protein [Hymenobacteraceae bacterium]MDX5511182.1 plastocyanin/azurin family copper-binding protein [Hymenobacteraceae bacterium]
MKIKLKHIAVGFLLLVASACGNKSKEELPETQEPTGSVVPVDHPDTLESKEALAVTHIKITASGNTFEDFAYSKDTIQIPKGTLVKLTLINESTEPQVFHNLVITENNKYQQAGMAGAKVGAISNYVPDSAYVIAATPLAKPGQTLQMEFPAPPPGVYDFVCTFPDHYKRMHGKLIVEEK